MLFADHGPPAEVAQRGEGHPALAVGAAHTMLSWDGTKWSKRKSNLPDDASLIRGL